MGTKRTFDTGRFDTLNRKIKESGKKRNSRAKNIRTTKQALDDFHQIATEFSNEVENSVENGMNRNVKTAKESAQRAAYLYGLYRRWSDEILDIDQEDGEEKYSQFRKEYGLGNGQRIKVDPKKIYENVDDESIHQAYEAAYDVLSSKYSDRFTEEELNSYKEKIDSYQKGNKQDPKYEHYSKSSRDDEKEYYDNPNYEDTDTHGEQYHNNKSNSHDTHHVSSNNLYSKFSQYSSARYRAAHNEESGGGFFGGNGGFPPRGSGRRMNGMGGGRGGGLFGLVENVSGLGNHGSFRVTWRPKIGPLVMNMGRKGPSSVSADLGPLRYMVWQRNRGIGAWFSSFDLPSILSFRGNRK